MALREIISRLRGFSTPFGGVSWNPLPSESEGANRLLVFLYDRRVLYVPAAAEIPEHAVRSVIEIKSKIAEVAMQFQANSPFERKLRAMREACNHFLNRVQSREDIIRFGSSAGHYASWEFLDALGQWRAFMALHIGQLAEAYEIEPPEFLKSILPQTSGNEGQA